MSNSDQSHEQHADGIVEAGEKAPVYFYLLFFGLIAWGVIFMGYYLFSGWSSGNEFEEKMSAHTAAYSKEAPTQTATAPAGGGIDSAALFAANCAGCHGADGKGGFGSDLSSSTYKYGRGEEAVKQSIAKGRGGKMPGFDGQLSAAEIDALTEYSINL
jgi:cytochrome c oxidase cbb3-type subunit 3